VIRSGGKSSYIGFGKFEGMGSEKGDIKMGMEYLKAALNAHTSIEMNPDQVRESARYHHDIAMCHHRDGDIEGAILEYKETTRILEDLLLRCPSNDQNFAAVIKRSRFDISSALSGLSVALADLGKDEESLTHALKSLEIRKALMGPNHASVAECLNNLGGLYFRQSNFNKAAEMYQESLRILLTKTQGKEENKYVALAYYNIGLTYEKLGIKKGMDAVYKALMIANHVWGPNHDQTIQIHKTFQQMSEKPADHVDNR
jgi:tetratricopeptide (TPR) repeat protein